MAKRICPFCKEKVKEEATLCKHCKSDLPPLPPKKWYQTWTGFFLIMFFLGIIGTAYDQSHKTLKPPPTAQEIAAKQEEHDSLDARVYAKHFVEKSLKAPTTARWQNAGDFDVVPGTDKNGKPAKGVWDVSGYVDAQNSFGAVVRTHWSVKMKKVGGSWYLIGMKSR